jgi:dTDP-4-amino-4,6-dideoxygalactose transaminase
MEPYRSHFPNAWRHLPHTESVVQTVLSLPTGTAVNERDIQVIANIVRVAVAAAAVIRERIRTAQRA